MFTVVREDSAVQFVLASNPSFVQPLLKRFEEVAGEWGAVDTGGTVIVLRELLANAITHGNHNELSRMVRCRVERVAGETFRIEVQDEGDGFDTASVDMTFPDDPRNMLRRGYVLVRRICRQIEFNDRGNRVAAVVATASGEEDA